VCAGGRRLRENLREFQLAIDEAQVLELLYMSSGWIKFDNTSIFHNYCHTKIVELKSNE
jgi:hypothetical protein